jgi:hypothetical protein
MANTPCGIDATFSLLLMFSNLIFTTTFWAGSWSLSFGEDRLTKF